MKIFLIAVVAFGAFALSDATYCYPPKIPYKYSSKYRRGFYVGVKLHFYCHPGYILKGSAYSTCKSYGWNPDLPTCIKIVTCPARKAPVNGFVSPVKKYYVEKDEITFSCKSGFVLDGRVKDECLSSGKWKYNETPHCRRITCPSRSAPRNGAVSPVQKEYFPGQEIEFTCKSGFELQGEDEDECLKNGRWEVDETPTCVRITCPSRSAPRNGAVSPVQREYFPGQEIEFSCKSGFELEGEDEDECLKNGRWKVDDTPTCVKITCPKRRAPENGSLRPVQNEYTPKQTIHFSCDTGYDLVGRDSDTCLSNGKWDINETPRCKKVTCPGRKAPENGSVRPVQKEYHPGQTIHFSCESGYILSGKDSDKCLSNGKWAVNVTPICKKASCKGRCGKWDYFHAYPCQCDFKCLRSRNCCSDFKKLCSLY